MGLAALAAASLGGLLTSSPSDAGPPPEVGSLTQLAGSDGCTSQTGSGGACTNGDALFQSVSTAVSPDGQNVYVVSANAIAIFDRDDTSGALTQKAGTAGCIATSIPTCGSHGLSLVGSNAVAVSPDGRSVYVTAGAADAIVVFDRNETTGTLTPKVGTAGCVQEVAGFGCADGRGLEWPNAVDVSADGENVYVASAESDAIAVFDRDDTSGALTQKAGTAGCIGSFSLNADCADGPILYAPRDVEVAPDGSNVYATVPGSSTVAVLDRDPTTGGLTRKANPDSCLTGVAGGLNNQCRQGAGLGVADDIDLSPDGTHLYVGTTDGIEVVDRDPSSGVLSQSGGPNRCIGRDQPRCPEGRGMGLVGSVAVSPDGRSVYAGTDSNLDTLAVLDRSERDGSVTQPSGTAGCLTSSPINSSGCAEVRGLLGVRSVAISPDGRSVYTASWDDGAVSVFARTCVRPFTDVPSWVRAAVDWASCANFISGYPDGTFRPDSDITRAQFVRLQYRVAGSPDLSGLADHGFSDVPDWVDDAVTWARAGDFMTGYPDGTFRPDLPISRGQVTRAAFRIAGEPAGAPAHPFPDVPAWLTESVNWVAWDPDGAGPEPSLMTGYPDGTFKPDRNITRAQTVRLTCRANTAPGTC